MLEGAPAPVIEDEWGYLLSADTFVAGRATNPTHPLWEQFEAVHQFHVPSYQSKYPPGQALFLALGQVLYHPILGAWLGCALMIASIIWMLLAWVSRGWACVGGWIATFQYVVVGIPFGGGTWGYWSQSYWGGALAAAGGAMVFGGVARVVKEARVGPAVIMGAGLLLLANTRPLEGLIACLLPALYAFVWLVRQRGAGARAAWGRVVLPLALVLAPGFAAMGWYNQQVTGKATEMPWNTHYEQYCVFPLFLWQEPVPGRDWNHENLAYFHGKVERYMHERHNTLGGFSKATAGKIARFGIFFFGPIYGIVLLLAAGSLLADRLARMAAAPVALAATAGLAKFNAPPHYQAAITGLVVLLIVLGLRSLQGKRRLGLEGSALVRLLLGLSFVGFLGGIAFSVRNAETTQQSNRRQSERMVEAEPGEHLVLVRFGPKMGNGDEWLFNAADLEGSRILWARDSSPEARQELLEHYPDRKVWLLRTGFGAAHPRPVPMDRSEPYGPSEGDGPSRK